MRRLEHLGLLHPNRGQIVDVKETSVVDLLRCGPPVRQTIGLRVEQLVEPIERARLASSSVELTHCRVDRLGDSPAIGDKRGKPPPDHLGLSVSLSASL